MCRIVSGSNRRRASGDDGVGRPTMGALSSHHVGLVDRRWVVFFLEEVGAADVCELVGFRHRILFFLFVNSGLNLDERLWETAALLRHSCSCASLESRLCSFGIRLMGGCSVSRITQF